MAKFESSVKVIPFTQDLVYRCVSDLSYLEKIRDRIPSHDIDKMSFTADAISVSSPVGEVAMHIIEREEPKCVKFETVKSPVPMHLWIQVLPVNESSSKMRLTIDADVPFFLKGVVATPLQEAVEKLADALASIPYDQLQVEES
jgi:hypothetical protein